MDHANHIRLTSDELTPDNLQGAKIYGANDETVGKVSHLHGSGAACQVVVDVGGFLGMGARPVVIGLGQLDFMRDEDGSVHAVTGWTKDKLEAMPRYEG